MKYAVLVAGLLVIACTEKKKDPQPQQKSASNQDTTARSPHFPVMDFLKSEIAYVDSLPVGIRKYITHGTKHDSGYIQLPEFHHLADEFIPEDLKPSDFNKNFKETSFFDNTTNWATFFYSNNNNASALKRVDVVSAKGEVYDEVKSVYLEKNYQSGDTTIIKRLYWRPQRNFQIITQATIDSKPPISEVVKVVWDNRE